MGQVKATEVEQTKKKTVDLIPEERLKEILNILLPYGYSHYDDVRYTGVSPYIGDTKNIITIVANDPEGWGSVFAICMERFSEEEDEENSLGFYKGIMKLIAPELHSTDDKFKSNFNVLDFNWAEDKVQDNRFPVKIPRESGILHNELIKPTNYADRQHLQHGLPGGDEADSRRND